ncbi:MAG: hypothetical protein HRT64_10480, partial [Erythrobacter sp.]|nr:hypothetical protein [Erythrobacter sp.]
TVWHVGIWIGLTITFEMAVRKRSISKGSFARTCFTALLLAISYGLFALLLGQVFGDTYPAAQLWPSGLVLGGLFTALGFLGDRFSEQPKNFPTWAAVIGANFYAFGLWLLPRVVGFGLIDVPKLAWGVQLP